MLEILRYQAEDGSQPFSEWLASIEDKSAQAKIRIRLRRLESGLFGDCKAVGDGVLELREHLGSGWRVYFGRHGRSVVVLLLGGSKRSQARDISLAKELWADWKRRQP